MKFLDIFVRILTLNFVKLKINRNVKKRVEKTPAGGKVIIKEIETNTNTQISVPNTSTDSTTFTETKTNL